MAVTRKKRIQVALPLEAMKKANARIVSSQKVQETRSAAVRQKIVRLQAGGRPRVLDLFAGCGGLSLGFHTSGCDILGALECDPDAARSHGLNFHNGKAEHCEARDITTYKPSRLARAFGLGDPALAVDIVIGGPPCQAFARVGRAKLRDIADHPEAFRHDPRARLYINYIGYVKAYAPLAVLMENVPDILNYGRTNIAEEICEALSNLGYECAYTLLNAAHFGVPQTRERMFLLAYRRELACDIKFPLPTHSVILPRGYESSRAAALKLSCGGLFRPNGHYRLPPEPSLTLPRAVTVEDAIGDMPKINARTLLRAGLLRRGTRRMDAPVPFSRPKDLSEFAKLMRGWPGFEAGPALYDHVIRYLPRDYDIFARLNPGDQYPEAHREALLMFEERLAQLRKKRSAPRPGTRAWQRLRYSIVPPYDPGKFPNKWRKMERNRPARTLMAHLGKDSYSHIHYDGRQARPISVREAARLQSFPDGFKFSGTMNPAFRQIGNAVPPLLALRIAETIVASLGAAVAPDTFRITGRNKISARQR